MKQLISAASVLVLGFASAALCLPAHAQTAAPVAKKGIVVQGGREAIGPKQDDPRAVSTDDCTGDGTAVPGTGTNDPAAQKGIIVQGGLEAIGPKQDDPRASATGATSLRAIGPKQDDPRAVSTACQRKKAKKT
ncbi:hypothetical protein [Lysobacter terrae]